MRVTNKKYFDLNEVYKVEPATRDYSNEPYFVKKAEKAAAFIKKHGLPNLPPKKKN
jgi:hypothetical protein